MGKYFLIVALLLAVCGLALYSQPGSNGLASVAFSALVSGTNTTAALLCGSGCSLAPTGKGSVSANNTGFGLVITSGNIAVNTAVIGSVSSIQAGAQTFCNSTTGTANYECSLEMSGSAVLNAYANGMRIALVADTASSTTATLNIDRVGQKTLYSADCTSQVGAGIRNGQMYQVWYNASLGGGVGAFCLVH